VALVGVQRCDDVRRKPQAAEAAEAAQAAKAAQADDARRRSISSSLRVL